MFSALGIDLQRWVRAGVDMVNVSHFFYTMQDGDYSAIRALVPEAALYLEMCHNTRQGQPIVNPKTGRGDSPYRRTTDIQYYSTAHLAYQRGFDGVSLFNFVYYRNHHFIVDLGPYDEPPFHVFKQLRDPALVASQPQHWFFTAAWLSGARKTQVGETQTFTLNIAPPATSWRTAGRLRIETNEDLCDSRWSAEMSGIALVETADRSEPYGSPYPQLLGTPTQHRAWLVPAELLIDGANTVKVSMLSGSHPVTIVFVDVAVA